MGNVNTDSNTMLEVFDSGTVQQILDNATALIFLTDIEGRFLFANPHFLDLLELPLDQIVGRSINEMFEPATAKIMHENSHTVITNRVSINFEEVIDLSRGPRTFLSNRFPVFDDKGEVYAVCGLSNDITDRKKIELGLRSATLALAPSVGLSVFETLVQHMATALSMDAALIGEVSPDGNQIELKALSIKGNLQETFSYPLSGTPCRDVVNLGQPVSVLEKVNEIYPDDTVDFGINASAYLAYPLRDKNGQIRGLTAVMRAQPLKQGEIEDQLMKIFAARASAELDTLDYQASLQASEEQYHGIFNTVLDGLAICQSDGSIVDLNPAFATMHEIDRPNARPLNIQEFIPPESRHFYQHFVETVSRGETVEFQAPALRADKSTYDAEIKGVPIYYRGERHLMCMIRDITEDRRKQSALARSENILRATVESALDCIISTDTEGRIVTFNPAAEATFGCGRDQVIGKKLDELFIPERYRQAHRQGMARCLASGKSTIAGKRMSLSALRIDGSEFPCELVTEMSESEEGTIFVGFLRDISTKIEAEKQQEELQNQLLQAQKMEAMGQLTGGMAHDFNNILTTMLGYTAMSLEDLNGCSDDKIVKYLSKIQQAGERARDLIKQMLIFSRGQKGEREVISPGALIHESIALLSSGLPDTLHFNTDNIDITPQVEATPVQLEQVLLNLCINARDAMPKGGQITIGVYPAHRLDKDLLCNSCKGIFRAADFVELSVTDDGEGIDVEHLERIFEPFYSTKEIKAGSGMGLATSHGIVHGHGGHIVVESTPGRGSCFKIFLPAFSSVTHNTSKNNNDDPGKPIAPEQFSARVLVIDDDPTVLEFMCDMLESRGFNTVPASSGEEALKIYSANPGIDLVITDLTLPKMNGLEVATQLTRNYGDLPIVLYTGYDENISPQAIEKAGVKKFMHKPVDIHTLTQEIKYLLNGK